MLVGSRLRSKRKEFGLTQEELGERIGVGKSAICCYESETRNPTLDAVADMIEIFGVTADYLLGTDEIAKIESTDEIEYKTMTKEESIFLDELRKDKVVYEMLFVDPKRGVELIKMKIG